MRTNAATVVVWLLGLSLLTAFRTTGPSPALRCKSSRLFLKEDKKPFPRSFLQSLSPVTLLPIPLVLFGWYEYAHPASLTTWLEPTLPHPRSTAWKYFLSGGISASFSHVVTVPFDVVKTKMQTSAKYGSQSLPSAVASILKNEGAGALLTGMLPTGVGFFIQGSLKYGFYEVFKPLVKLWLLSEGIAADKVVIFMLASMLAELIGSSTLSPFEATRIRQVAEPGFAKDSMECALKMVRTEGPKALFLSLPPLLLKNVPYTILQLSSFEYISSLIYCYLADKGMPGAEALQYQVEITSISALIAAFLGTVASQPGDAILSAVNSRQGPLASKPSSSILGDIAVAAKSLGLTGMLRGVQARLVHVSSIVVIQLLVYDYIKQLVGIPVTGFGSH